MTENISSILEDKLCNGCGTCISICPNNSLNLIINSKKGIYVPEINQKNCKNCGICLKVCPGRHVDFNGLNEDIFNKKSENIIGVHENYYIGRSTDDKLVYNCSSGGLVTSILIYSLNNGLIDGALVTKMNKENPFEPEPFIARTEEEILSASKSKYCPVPANIALKEILNSKKGEKFAVVGLSCHIQGIRKAEQVNKILKDKIVLHIGLWCSVTCNFNGTDFVFNKFNINKDDILFFNYRGEGWPGGLLVKFKDGTEQLIHHSDYWDIDFSSFAPSRCRLCSDASAELADISLGDYRGKNKFSNDLTGLSGVISRNMISENILRELQKNNEINIIKIDYEDVAAGQQFFYSKKKLKSVYWVFSLFGRKFPEYNQFFIEPRSMDYLSEILIEIRSFMASHNKLWTFLRLFNFVVYKMIFNLVKNVKKQ